MVWFVGEDRRWFQVDADPELQAAILACAQATWTDYVERKVLPTPSGPESLSSWSPRIRKALARVEMHKGEIVQATDEQGRFIEAWERAKAVGTKFTAAAEAARDWILAQMGTAEFLSLPDGRCYRRSKVSVKGYVRESGEHVELREMKTKKGT